MEEQKIPVMIRPKRIFKKLLRFDSENQEEKFFDLERGAEENNEIPQGNIQDNQTNLPFKRGEGFCTRCLIF